MSRWYSPRGARRGLLAAALAAILWMCWAWGYLQGVGMVSRPGKEPAHFVIAPGAAAGCDACHANL